MTPGAYEEAGVDLAGADRHVERIAPLVTRSWGPNVIGGFGGFAAGVEIPAGYESPVLMMSADGVGTKLEVARMTRRWDGVGYDLVAMCVDDLAAAGASPIGLVDYLAVGKLDPERDSAIVESVAQACIEAGCALLGGETAEHPGVMEPDSFDLAGAVMGVVERGEELTGASIEPGDVVIGIPSPNLRSNGFSLVRKLFEGRDLGEPFTGEDATVADVLLRPSVIYGPAVLRVVDLVEGAAHITGGGMPGNLIRVLPEDVKAIIELDAWEIPNVFEQIQRMGDLTFDTMAATFNLGIGFCLIARPENVGQVIAGLNAHHAIPIGRIEAGKRAVEIV